MTTTFNDVPQFASGANPLSVVSADINDDGTFRPKQDFASPGYPWSVAIADGDGTSDVIVTDNSDSVGVLLNETIEPTDPVTAITTSQAPGSYVKAGGSVTFTLDTEMPVTVTGNPQLLLSNNAVASYSGTDGDGKPQFTYTAASGDDTGDLKVTGLSFNGGTITAPGQMSFQPKQDYTVGSFPLSVTTADVNGDGNTDLVVGNEASNTISVLLGNGDGSFQAKQDFLTGDGGLFSVTTEDLNADGKIDLVATDRGNSAVSVLLGNGDGTFQPKQDFATGSSPSSVITADINSDGKSDLIAGNSSSAVSVLLGNGDGTFQTKQDFAIGGNFPSSVVTADVNGDGKIDLIVSNQNNNTVSVLLGNGNGTFQTKQDFATGSNPTSVTTADVNGDGKTDLITANNASHTVSVLLGNGNGAFQAKQDYATGGITSVAATDLNGDGKIDLATGGYSKLSVLLGNGDGTFQTKQDFGGGTESWLTTADVNGDGKADIVLADAGTNKVSVLLNTSSPPATFDPSSIASVTGADTGIIIDTTPPSASVTLGVITSDNALNASEAAGTVAVTGTVGGDVQNGDNVSLVVNGTTYSGAISGGGFSINVAGSDLAADSDHTIDASVTTTDLAGNSTTATASKPYNVDTVIATPTIVLTNDTGSSNSDGITSNATLTISPAAADVARSFVIDGGASSASYTAPTVDGAHTVVVTDVDTAGNSASASITFALDTTPPSASVALNSITADNALNASEAAGTVAVTGTVGGDAQNGDSIALIVNGTIYSGAVSGGGFSINVAGSDLMTDADHAIEASVTTTDLAGNTTTATATKSYSVAAVPTTVSLFTAADTPALTSLNDGRPLEVGMKFTSSLAGDITALKFYRSASDTGPDLLDLWTATGTRLATTTFTNTSASGWQTVALVTPVAIAANTTYVVSYHTSGAYAATDNFFASALTSGPLTAPSSAAASGNGVYAYGGTNTEGLFPANTYSSANYYADVVFSSTAGIGNTIPTAVADTADATEKGGIANGSGGSLASGNVLTNDIDPDAGDTRTVITVYSGAAAGTPGTALSGTHGSLVLDASGSFTYTVNETDAAVQALLSTNTLTDVFSYTMRDTAGATSTSTLTVSIHGANDAPVLTAQTGDQNAVIGSAFSLTLPAGTFNDVDVGDALSYTATAADGSPLPAWLTFDATTRTFSGTPTAANLGTFSVKASAADPGNLSASETFNIAVTTAPTTVSLFTAADTPALTSLNDGRPLEVGMKFTSSLAGDITALKFYRSASDTGPDLLDLWTATGTRLATTTFTNTTASGWQTVALATPVAIAANTTYVVSYHTSGAYAATDNFFASALTSGPLTAPSSAAASGNGVYAYGGTNTEGLFPANTYSSANYYADVVFRPQLAA